MQLLKGEINWLISVEFREKSPEGYGTSKLTTDVASGLNN